MKKNQNKLLFKKTAMLFLMMVLFVACDKGDDAPTNPVDQLPPATQTGAGTFGCLVNGEPFVDNSGFFNCFYQLVNGEYYFGISASIDRNDYVQLSIGSLKAELMEGDILLLEREETKFYALLSFDCICPQGKTSTSNPGLLQVTKFDLQNNIVSATFEFMVIDPNTGTIYEITEGRFDSFFTQ